MCFVFFCRWFTLLISALTSFKTPAFPQIITGISMSSLYGCQLPSEFNSEEELMSLAIYQAGSITEWKYTAHFGSLFVVAIVGSVEFFVLHGTAQNRKIVDNNQNSSGNFFVGDLEGAEGCRKLNLTTGTGLFIKAGTVYMTRASEDSVLFSSLFIHRNDLAEASETFINEMQLGKNTYPHFEPLIVVSILNELRNRSMEISRKADLATGWRAINGFGLAPSGKRAATNLVRHFLENLRKQSNSCKNKKSIKKLFSFCWDSISKELGVGGLI